MSDLLPFLIEMISEAGISGYENPVANKIEKAWRPLVDQLSYSKLGSLHGIKYGTSPVPRPNILIAVHMDAIGFMVTGIDEGFLRITEIGGADPRILPGQKVLVHGRSNYPGRIVLPPPYLRETENESSHVKISDLMVDIGLEPEQVNRDVQVGDLVSFDNKPIMMGKDLICGHTLDNRSSVAALTFALEILQDRKIQWDVHAVATVQEEENYSGAYTSAFHLQPDLAVALDVTFASSPGSSTHNTFPLGKGITLGWGPNIHPTLHNDFKSLAEQLEITNHIEIVATESGTDAFAIQVSGKGVPCMIIGIPIRYMHTQVEMASMKDIYRSGRLIAEFISHLDKDYLSTLSWDS